MATAYVSFCRPLSSDTATLALFALRGISLEVQGGNAQWDTVHLNIACEGGNLIPGLTLYNELRSLPFKKIITHNTAAMDSPAILFFMAGSQRFACNKSVFRFSQPGWTFASKLSSRTEIANAQRWLDTYQTAMCEIVSSDTKLSCDEVRNMIDSDATMTPTEALKHGLIHDVCEPTFPFGARWHQI